MVWAHLAHLIAVLLDRFTRRPKLAGLVGAGVAVAATVLAVLFWQDYRRMSAQPQSATLAEAAGIPDAKPWVRIEDGVWTCRDTTYWGSDRTYAVLTDASQTVVAVVLYSGKLNCDDFKSRQASGTLRRLQGKELSAAVQEHNLGQYPNATAFLEVCGFCDPGNSLGLVIIALAAAGAGLLLYPLALREHRNKYGAEARQGRSLSGGGTMDGFKRLLGRGTKQVSFSDEDFERSYELKKQGMERVLGSMHDIVWHAIIPFAVGGAVDMYPFLEAVEGTAYATMELIKPDGSGPLPSRIGTYELVACSRHKPSGSLDEQKKDPTQLRIWRILTQIAHYSCEAVLNPGETCEVPADKDKPELCIIFDEWKKPGVDFMIVTQKHGLLLCMGIFRSEMDYAMEHGSELLLERLKAKGYYPYCDVDRDPVA